MIEASVITFAISETQNRLRRACFISAGQAPPSLGLPEATAEAARADPSSDSLLERTEIALSADGGPPLSCAVFCVSGQHLLYRARIRVGRTTMSLCASYRNFPFRAPPNTRQRTALRTRMHTNAHCYKGSRFIFLLVRPPSFECTHRALAISFFFSFFLAYSLLLSCAETDRGT